MKRPVVGIAVVALLAGLAGCVSKNQGTATPTVPAMDAAEKVVAEGKVVPVKSAALSLSTGGTVVEVLAAEGQAVEAGQVLLRLDGARQRAAVAGAEAALVRAKAHLDELKAGARPEEVAVARAALRVAQAALQRLKEGPSEAEVAAARAEAANAEAAVKQAQWAYDRVAAYPGAGARPESLALEQATNNYLAARGRLDALLAGARPGELAVAQAEIDRAQAELALTQAAARPETISAAEADVAAAAAALDEARVALAERELKAPFAGTVAALDARVGEQVAPGVVIARLADLSAWQIETSDLTELDVAGIHEGSSVTITFDAIPELELAGKVVRVRPFGEQKQGDIVYTVTIAPDRFDERLRWNMTAAVTIETGTGD